MRRCKPRQAPAAVEARALVGLHSRPWLRHPDGAGLPFASARAANLTFASSLAREALLVRLGASGRTLPRSLAADGFEMGEVERARLWPEGWMGVL